MSAWDFGRMAEEKHVKRNHEREAEATLMGNGSEGQERSVQPRTNGYGEGSTIVGRFRVLRCVSPSLYHAHDEQRDRPVWLRICHGSRLLTEFKGDHGDQLKEAGALGDGVSNVLKVGKVDSDCFVASEFIEGQFLDEALNRRLFSTDEAVAVIRSLLQILQRGHKQGLVHRGINPTSVILTSKNRVQLLEYAIDARWKGGSANGSLHAYQAPEQVDEDESNIGPTTDVYSIGVLLYELLTGTVPFKGDHCEALDELILFQEPTPVRQLAPEVPPRLAETIKRCLSKEPQQRFSSLAELNESLANCSTETVVQSPSPPTAEKAKQFPLRTVVSVVLLLALLPTAYFVGKDRVVGLWSVDPTTEKTVVDSNEAETDSRRQQPDSDVDSPLAVESDVPAVTKMREGGIDLLSQIELPRDIASRPWRREGDNLICEPTVEQNAILRLPFDAPAEYTIEFMIRAIADPDLGGALLLGLGNDQVGFGAHLKVGSSQCWLFDYGSEPASPGNGMHKRRLRAGPWLASGKPTLVTCTVTPNSVRIAENGQVKLEWTGDLGTLSREWCWAQGNREKFNSQRDLFICTWGSFEFSEIRVHPKLAETRSLSELNTPGDERGPWLSADGLRIYWWVRPTLETTQSEIWTAERNDANSLFTNKKRLAIGEGFALSGDELEMILLPGRDKDLALHVAKRERVDHPFGPPELLKEFEEYRFDNPFLSENGLTLIIESRSTNGKPYIATRPDRNSQWSKPQELDVPPTLQGEPFRWRSPYLSEDGTTLWGTIIEDRINGEGAMLIRATRPNPSGGFTSIEQVAPPDVGTDLAYPRFCTATGELFFVKFPKPGDLWVTKSTR